jgi:hypothetical protein
MQPLRFAESPHLLQSSFDVSARLEKGRRHSQPGCRFSFQSRDVGGGGDIACYAFISAFLTSCAEGPGHNSDVLVAIIHGAYSHTTYGSLRYYTQHRNVSSCCYLSGDTH